MHQERAAPASLGRAASLGLAHENEEPTACSSDLGAVGCAVNAGAAGDRSSGRGVSDTFRASSRKEAASDRQGERGERQPEAGLEDEGAKVDGVRSWRPMLLDEGSFRLSAGEALPHVKLFCSM